MIARRKMKFDNVLTVHHSRWNEFIDLLEGPEGCDFRQSDPNDVNTITWKCTGNKELTKKVLEIMGMDVEYSIDLLPPHFCDCEIVFNLDTREIEE